jgi:hypothetical protein
VVTPKRVVVLVTGDAGEESLVRAACDTFSIPLEMFKTFDALTSWEGTADLVIASATGLEAGVSLTELVQGVRQFQPAAFLLAIASDSLPKEEGTFLRKSGASFVLLRAELESTGKLAFALSQVLKPAYVPVKVSELVADTEPGFALYHLQPLRGKFLCFHPAGVPLPADKLDRMKSVAEYYIRREDCYAFAQYVKTTADSSAAGLALRCRANFLALQQEYTMLAMNVSDRSELVSFGEGKDLLGRCRKLCEDLLGNLGAYPKAWEVINLSGVGEFGSVERAPAATAYTAIFGLHLEVKELTDLMIVALLGEIGLLCLPNALLAKLRDAVACGKDEAAQLNGVPELSLKVILDKKISLDEKWRKVLLRTRARADGDLRVTEESQLLHLARLFDQKCVLRLGGQRAEPKVLLTELVEAAKPGAIFSEEFHYRLKTVLVDSFG